MTARNGWRRDDERTRNRRGTGGCCDVAGFAWGPPARLAAGAARDAGAAADRPVPGTRGSARGLDAGRLGHPRGPRVREDRRDAGGDRPVHDAAADGRVRRPRIVAPPGGGRGFRDRGHTRRRAYRSRGGWVAALRPAGRARGPAGRGDAAACPAGQARVPGEFPLPHRAGRVPYRRRHPGGCRPAARHARGDRGGRTDTGQAPGHAARAPARAVGQTWQCRPGSSWSCLRRARSLQDPPDPGGADRGDHRDRA